MEIGLKYISGFMNEGDFQDFCNILSKAEIELAKFDISGHPQNLSADIIAPIVFMLSTDFYSNYLSGVLASLTIDAIKTSILFVWEKTAGKSMSIIQSGSKVTQSGIDIDIQVRMKNGNKFTLRLGADVPKELKKQAVKLAFEAIKNILPASTSDYKGVFNIQENAWSIFTMQEYIRKLLAKGK